MKKIFLKTAYACSKLFQSLIGLAVIWTAIILVVFVIPEFWSKIFIWPLVVVCALTFVARIHNIIVLRSVSKKQKKVEFQKVEPTIIDEVDRLPKNLSDRVDLGTPAIEPDEEDEKTGED